MAGIEKLLVEPLTTFGLPGIVIALLFGLIVILLRQHREERKEWRTEVTSNVKRSQDLQDQTNTVVRELAVAIREAKK